VSPADPVESSTSVDRRIEARIAELARRVRAVIQDPDSPQRDVDRAMSELMPELQRLTEYLEAAGGPRFARVCEGCGRLDLRTRWPTMLEAEDAVGADGGSWRCRWCSASEFVVLELRDAVSVTRQGPRPVER
jgi:hypothetical protein